MSKTNFKSKTCCVVDNGMYPHVAIKLAESFKQVFYFTDWQCAFPTCEPLLVGEGFPGVKRVKDFWKEASDADLFVFTDIYQSGFQLELIRQGKRVWGPRNGDELEICRWKTNEMLPKLGLPKPKAAQVTGIPKLREYLKSHENCFVKVSGLRGLMETKHHVNYRQSEYWLDTLEKQLSGAKHLIVFVIFDAIDPAVEVGYDGWTVDGKYPEVASFGLEIKDCGLISCVREFSDFPEPILDVMEAFSPVLKKMQYRGFCCAEMRVNERGPYMIDWAARCGSPSSEALLEVFSNWPEILWFGAEGKLVRPEQQANFSVEIIVKSPEADPEEWKVVEITDEARPWVKLHLWARIDGVDTICPNEFPLKEFGAVVGIGDTLGEAIAHVRKNCEGVSGDSIEFETDAIDKGLEEIAKGEKMGVDFGVEIPIDKKAGME